MQIERDVLVRRTFPALRARLRERGVELTEVDLRWGVTADQGQRGETLPICLSEIERCRPFFIALLGERYGWVVPHDALTEELRRTFPVLDEAGRLSLTEIEIRQALLPGKDATSKALFFVRDPNWLSTLPAGEREAIDAETPDARQCLADLKARVASSGAMVSSYASPEDIGDAVLSRLGAQLDELFPAGDVTADRRDRSEALHAAYARDRLGIHLGAEEYFAVLDRWLGDDTLPPLLVTGASGGGKSALLANWLACRTAGPGIVFMHFLGASPDSADPVRLLRRLWQHLDRATGDEVAEPANDEAVINQFSQRLARASSVLQRSGIPILVVLDGLDKLSAQRDLQWLPDKLPLGVRLLASALPGPATEAAGWRGWRSLTLGALAPSDQMILIERSLAKVGKSLTHAQATRIQAHTQAGNPLFLKTVLDELRVFGHYDHLDQRIDWYLSANDMPALYDRVLERLDVDHGRTLLHSTLTSIWASRAGLEETELIAIAGVPPLLWSALRLGLGESIRDLDGRMQLGHDYLRQAVVRRYLTRRADERAAHLMLADHFAATSSGARRAEELPYQLHAAEAWDRLTTVLCNMDASAELGARGELELVGYWLPLVAQGRDPEALLCAAFWETFPDPDRWNADELRTVNRLSDLFAYRGEFGDAFLRLLRHAAEVSERLIASLPEDVSCIGHLADALRTRGDISRAREIEQQQVELLRRHRGAEHASTLYATANLAATLEEMGELQAAQALQEELLAIRTRLHGAHHRDTYAVAYNLAHTMRARGHREAARALQHQVLDGMMRLFGPDHRETLMAIETLAVTHYQLGDFAEAERLERRVVETRIRVLGPDHPDTLRKMEHLADTLRIRSKRKEALELMHEVLASQVRQLGPEHPETLDSRSQIASIFRESGQISEAVQLETAVLEVRTKKWGPDDESTRQSLKLIAYAHFNGRNLHVARDFARRRLESYTRTHGPHAGPTLAAQRFHRDVVRSIRRRRVGLVMVLVGWPLLIAGWVADRFGLIDVRGTVVSIRSWLGLW